VKGRESIPYRKATAPKKPSGEGTGDEEMLGLSAGWLRWVLPVAGLLLIVALGLAVAQVLTGQREDGRRAERKARDTSAAGRDDQDRDSGTPGKDAGLIKDPNKDKSVVPSTDKGKGKEDDKDRGKGKEDDKDKDKGKGELPPPVASRVPPPSKEVAAVASYAGAYEDLPGVLVRRKADVTGP